MKRTLASKGVILSLAASLLFNSVNYAAAAPSNRLLPTITGEARVGTSLTVNTGSWSSTQVTFNIQWFSCSTTLSTSCVAQ